MALTATFWILEIKDLELLRKTVEAESAIKKSWLDKIKKPPESFFKKMETIAVERINYRYSGMAFTILAVFSKEKLNVDWENLLYSNFANEFSQGSDSGIYIFSIMDKDLQKLKPTGLFYSMQELDQFAVDFEGNKPGNPDIMKNSIKELDEVFRKLTKERVVLLAMTNNEI